MRKDYNVCGNKYIGSHYFTNLLDYANNNLYSTGRIEYMKKE